MTSIIVNQLHVMHNGNDLMLLEALDNAIISMTDMWHAYMAMAYGIWYGKTIRKSEI
jgi:hypothetical protein